MYGSPLGLTMSVGASLRDNPFGGDSDQRV
jgi:hypothetical protein